MEQRDVSRRKFLGYVIAGPTLVVGAPLLTQAIRQRAIGASGPTLSPVPTAQAVDSYDLTDMLTGAAQPTSHLITITVNPDGTASFALPRAEVGQGLTTAFAMIIGDEMDLPVDKVNVTLADARPELVWNQLTGGSNSVHAMYQPVRVAAALARDRLLEAAVILLGIDKVRLQTSNGMVIAPNGRKVSYGQLAKLAAAHQTARIEIQLKHDNDLHIIGTPQRRVDALDAVTGRKQFTMDLTVPDALPTMVCRPPTINGTVGSVDNRAAVLAMPGVTDVVVIPTGVAVRAATFGQCIDAVNALEVTWNAGTIGTKSEPDIAAELAAAELPMAPNPPTAQSIEQLFTFQFVSNSPLETNCAIADVRTDSAVIWASMKTPITAQEMIANALGLLPTQLTCHVITGGGSFGRHLFFDAPMEAALASKAMGKPVKLMWHRTDDFRQGRMHPMATSRVRVAYSGGSVLAYQQRHTSVSTDFKHGVGEIITAEMAQGSGNDRYANTVFNLTQNVPYNFGVVDQEIAETEYGFNTSSMRNIYSPNVTTARELMVDQIAAAMSTDPYEFRKAFVRDDRSKAVLEKVATVGNWGRSMAPGTAQGLGIHNEYKGHTACLVEIDCRPETVNRSVEEGYTGPRVTKVVFAVDVGLPINPRGLEAQMMGGVMDALALILSYSIHIKDGYALEGSWAHAHYTRQWNVPFDLQVIVMPPTSDSPGGAGELGVASACAAVATAYARATGTLPTTFPINHNLPLDFVPQPTVPPLPQSPTDGLSHTF